MIDIDEGRRIVLSHVRLGPVVRVPLREAVGRTLAAPVACDVDDPPFDRAVMDGYTVRAEDVAKAPVTLRVVGQIAAGCIADHPLARGEAMQINTGAPIPTGADAVIRVEDTGRTDGSCEVLIRKTAKHGQFITRRATYVSAGQTVLETAALLTPLAIGAAAAAGASTVTVYRRPTVAVLATGDELIDIDAAPTGAQIRNSSQYLLDALIRSAGGEPVLLGVARDDRTALRERIVEGLRSDVFCLTGGISMGAFDFVPEVLAACGATFHIRKMAIKPGRPTVFATTADGTLIFGLPGNPISTFVGFELLVRTALAAMQGRAAAANAQAVRATLRGSLRATADRRSFWPARVRVDADGGLEAEALSWHGSGDSFGAATANALIIRPPDQAAVSSGDAVSVVLLERI